jgi:hypothetical protein
LNILPIKPFDEEDLDHPAGSHDTPLRADAFDLTDEEKSKLFADRINGLSSIQTFHLIMERHFNVATYEDDDPQDYRFVFLFDN